MLISERERKDSRALIHTSTIVFTQKNSPSMALCQVVDACVIIKDCSQHNRQRSIGIELVVCIFVPEHRSHSSANCRTMHLPCKSGPIIQTQIAGLYISAQIASRRIHAQIYGSYFMHKYMVMNQRESSARISATDWRTGFE